MQLILSGKADEPMRVLLITNPKDSVILRSKSTDFLVSENDTLLQLFTKRLYSTVTDPASRGVGIAAPQVGILKKIIWIKRFDKDDEPFEAYYNPKITKYTDLKQDVLEGCLSIPNVRDTTHYRSYAVLLEYDNPKGQHKCEMVEAFTAVIFQHEIDHLNGILFTDHLEKERKALGNHELE
jgi:peptide deformylase